MNSNLVDEFELHAYGKQNVRLAEEVCLMLHKWMHVLDIESGFTDMPNKQKDCANCYLVVFFKRANGFNDGYRLAKEQAVRIRKMNEIK